MLYYTGKQAIDIAATLEDGNKMNNNNIYAEEREYIARVRIIHQKPQLCCR